MNILNCIREIFEFDLDEFSRLNIGVEIQDFTQPDLDSNTIEKRVEKYKSLFKGFNGIISIHGPFLDLKPASPDPDIRRVSVNKYLKALHIGKELNVDYIVFHSQINPKLNEPNLVRLSNLQTKEFWMKVLEDSGYNKTVLIENVFEDDPKMLKEYIETVNIPNLKINLDVGHVKLTKCPLEKWIRELKDYIVYLHIHSNDGKNDKHEAPTKDEILNIIGLLKKYNINPILSLEYLVDNIEDEVKKYRKLM